MGWRLSPMRIQREGAQLQIRGTWPAGPGDDQARFLADLRALRDSAAIGYAELAARAHYPSDVLKEAENGPCLPGLPILVAYVRACEGDILDWEERWRRLNPEAAEDPDLPVRPAGASPAAVAGARAGVGVGASDVHDPERIRAALRGDHVRPAQDGRRANDQGSPALAARAESADQDLLMDSGGSRDSAVSPDSGASRGAGASWDTPADPGITSANGNHSAEHSSRGPFDAASTVVSDPADHTEPAQDEDFSWLNNSQPEAPPAEPADRGFSWLEPEEGGLTSPEQTDFWAKPATSSSSSASASADLQLPAPAPRAEEPAIARASWPAPADTTTTSAAEPAQRAATGAAPGAASPAAAAAATAAQPLSSAGSAGSAGSAAQAAVSERDDRRQYRFFSVRLLAVIVIAALIGSALVLLLK